MSIMEQAGKLWKPPPRLTVSEWADEFRQLSSEASAEPGRWATSRAEYQRGIMDALAEPDIETVVVMSSAQVGKTEILNNIVGYFIDQDPSPVLVLQPTLEMAHAWSKDRLAPMIRDTQRLSEKIELSNRRNSANTLLHKTFPGGHVTMAGANSPVSLASRPIRIVLADEVDRMPVSAGTEGDPINLARKRTTTFFNRKVLLTSTPTLKGASRIEYEYSQTDQRRFYVPCPDCGHSQVLEWSHVKWQDNDPTTAAYCCDNCGVLWTESQRVVAISRGEWRATAKFTGKAGFHLSEIYSPWVPLAKMVRGFLDSKSNPEMLKTWVNTSLGESWEDPGDTVDYHALYVRRERYDAQVPDGALLLTAGIDVQRDRLEVEVVGWGEGEESWNVDYRIIPGDTTLDEVWNDLENVLAATYEHETGTAMQITSAVIDSGDQTTRVYDYVTQSRHPRLFAGKGVPGAGRPVAKVSRATSGRKRRQVDLYQIGVDDAKATIFARLQMREPGPGYCHFPLERDPEYFDQLTAEKLVTRYYKGFPRREWVKTRPRNEVLDCRVYAFAALKILNPVWSSIEKRLAAKPAATTKTEPELRRTTQRRRPVRNRKSWAADI
jgi:phage terminase large subunit GpA-like protein